VNFEAIQIFYKKAGTLLCLDNSALYIFARMPNADLGLPLG